MSGEEKKSKKGGDHTKCAQQTPNDDAPIFQIHAAVVAFIRVRRGSRDDYDRPSSYRRLSL